MSPAIFQAAPIPEPGKVRMHAVLFHGIDGALLVVESLDVPELWCAPFATYGGAFDYAKSNGLIQPSCEQRMRTFTPTAATSATGGDWINGNKTNLRGLYPCPQLGPAEHA